MVRRFALVVFALALAAVPAGAVNFGASAEWWSPGLSGQYRLDAEGVTGSWVDLTDDLGMGDESLPSAEGFFEWDPHRLSLGWTRGEWEGHRRLAKPLVHGGRFLPQGLAADSQLSFDMTDATYTYRVLGLDRFLAGFSLDAGVRLKYLEGEESLSSGAFSSQKDFAAPIPELAAGARLYILEDLLAARAQAQGLAFAGNSLLEGKAELSLSPLPMLGLTVGYRFLFVDGEYDGFHLDLDLAGFYAQMGVSF